MPVSELTETHDDGGTVAPPSSHPELPIRLLVTAVLEHTVLPPTNESSLTGIVAALKRNDRVSLASPDDSSITLPAEVYEALRDVVTAMASGQAITIARHDSILTTQEAADLLSISRPTLVRLPEAGEIPFSQPGRHRRVSLADLVTYQQRVRQTRRGALNDMTNEAAADESYTQNNAFVRTR